MLPSASVLVGGDTTMTAESAYRRKWRRIFAEGRRIAEQGSFTEDDVMQEIKNHRSQK